MTNFLFAKNKTYFVDGTLKKLDTSSSEYKSWMRCDAMIKGWLTTAMEKGIRDSLKYANTSSEIWSDLKERFGKKGFRTRSLIGSGTKLDKGEEEGRVNATQYRRLVGRLLYLQATRPDVTYAVNVLSQFVSDPRQNRLEAAKQVLMYLKGTPRQGILLPREGPTTLTTYCNSDWLGCPFRRQDGPEQEAEYKVMASTVSEILWVRWLLKDMQVQLTTLTSLFCDNQAARHIANNPVYHERTKHVEMDCLFVRERVETRDIEPKQIKSKL
nr:hypothetical protein [Tanacetum cinerariifolium]